MFESLFSTGKPVRMTTKRQRWLAFAYLGILLISLSTQNALAQSRLPVSVSNNVTPAVTLSNYTARVAIDAASAPGFDFSNNGDDIIVWDESTTSQLDFYVESVDAISQTAVIWVRVPSIPTSPPDTLFYVDYNRTDVLSPLSDATTTFLNTGFTYHSQPHTSAAPGPESRAAGEAEFNFDEVTANTNYGCTTLSEINADHSGVFTQNGDFALSITSQIQIPSDAQYEFRFGGDFGSGGELYIDDTTLEEGWTDDLWWATNYSNPDVLQGSLLLTAGSYTLKALGYERCCDGRAELQYRYDSDGDGSLADETFSRLTTSSPGITLLAPSCPVAQVILGSVTTVPVTLAKFSSTKIGPYIKFNWETADETFNAGFRLWALVENDSSNQEQTWIQLSRKFIRSKSFDSMDVSSYTKTINTKGKSVDKVAISSVDLAGKEEFFGPFDIGEEYGDSYTPQPINWSQVVSEYKQRMADRGFTLVNKRWKRINSLAASTEKGSALVGVNKSGLVKVSYEDLLQAGIDWQGVNVNEIAVIEGQNSIPRFIFRKSKGSFGPGSYIIFNGRSPNDSDAIYALERIYKLQINRSLVQKAKKISRKSNNSKTWAYKTSSISEDKQHLIFSPFESPWIMDLLFRAGSDASLEYKLHADKPLDQQLARLTLSIAGISNTPRVDFDLDGELDEHHDFVFFLNNEPIGERTFNGHIAKTISIDFPSSKLLDGDNVFKIALLANGYDFDIAAIDWLELNYPSKEFSGYTQFEEIEDNDDYDGIKIQRKRISGEIGFAFDKHHNLMKLRLKNEGKNSFSMPFVSRGEAGYFVGLVTDIPSAVSVNKITKSEEIHLQDTDMLVIAHPSFIGDELKHYLETRRLQGVSSELISTEYVQENFGVGMPLHKAIQIFLRETSKSIDYEHVLLVGGHSYDYLNRINEDQIHFIPTFYSPIGSSRFTPTDQPFIDFDLDGYPDKTIGRWPVRDIAQLVNIIDKSEKWAEGKASRTSEGIDITLMADQQREYDFANDLDQHFLDYTNLQQRSIDRIYIDQISQSLNGTGDLNTEIRTRVKTRLSERTSWLLYNGHGSPNAWSFSQMLSSEKVSDIDNTSPFLITSLGCYTTYYESPSHDSLALKLLFEGSNAAFGVHGPSVVGFYENQMRLASSIARNTSENSSIGHAIKEGMRALPTNYRTSIQNWALLADPSLPAL